MELFATPYGFHWGLTEVTRLADHHGGILIGIKTPRQEVHVWVTPTGLIRVNDLGKPKTSPVDPPAVPG
jgi:hypothetical protein